MDIISYLVVFVEDVVDVTIAEDLKDCEWDKWDNSIDSCFSPVPDSSNEDDRRHSFDQQGPRCLFGMEDLFSSAGEYVLSDALYSPSESRFSANVVLIDTFNELLRSNIPDTEGIREGMYFFQLFILQIFYGSLNYNVFVIFRGKGVCCVTAVDVEFNH